MWCVFVIYSLCICHLCGVICHLFSLYFFYAVCVCYVCWVYHPSFTTGIATDVLILGLVNVGNGRQGGSGALTDQSAFAVRYDDVAT